MFFSGRVCEGFVSLGIIGCVVLGEEGRYGCRVGRLVGLRVGNFLVVFL